MSRISRPVAVAIAALAMAGCGNDGDRPEDSITLAPMAIGDAWARATVPAATTGAVYLDLTAADDDELVGAAVSADIAADITLHQTMTGTMTGTMTSGTGGPDDHGDAAMVTMTDLDRLPLPAGEPVSLQPGGTHLMLVDLDAPLVDGTNFEVTLHFANADDVTVVVAVRAEP